MEEFISELSRKWAKYVDKNFLARDWLRFPITSAFLKEATIIDVDFLNGNVIFDWKEEEVFVIVGHNTFEDKYYYMFGDKNSCAFPIDFFAESSDDQLFNFMNRFDFHSYIKKGKELSKPISNDIIMLKALEDEVAEEINQANSLRNKLKKTEEKIEMLKKEIEELKNKSS